MQLDLFETSIEEKLHETFIKDLKRGSGFSNSKKRIYNLFNKNLTKSEIIEMLKDEYGVGAFCDSEYSQSHDRKGIKIKTFGVYGGERLYTWSQVYDALSSLIEHEKYIESLEES